MPVSYRRIRFVGSCIFGIVFAISTALLLSILTAKKDGFMVFVFPLAIVFTVLCERFWARGRKQDAEFMREQCKKRHEEGKPPFGMDDCQ